MDHHHHAISVLGNILHCISSFLKLKWWLTTVNSTCASNDGCYHHAMSVDGIITGQLVIHIHFIVLVYYHYSNGVTCQLGFALSADDLKILL